MCTVEDAQVALSMGIATSWEDFVVVQGVSKWNKKKNKNKKTSNPGTTTPTTRVYYTTPTGNLQHELERGRIQVVWDPSTNHNDSTRLVMNDIWRMLQAQTVVTTEETTLEETVQWAQSVWSRAAMWCYNNNNNTNESSCNNENHEESAVPATAQQQHEDEEPFFDINLAEEALQRWMRVVFLQQQQQQPPNP